MNYQEVVGVVAATFLIAVGFVSGAYVIGQLARRQTSRSSPFLKFLFRYGLVFGLLLGLEVLVLWSMPALHEEMRNAVAFVVGGLLRLVGTDVSVAGPLISVGGPELMFDVTTACLGGVLFWVYLALVSAEARASHRQRLKAIFIGLAVLFVFNIVRIFVSVYLEGVAGLRVHDYFYLVNMLAVLLVWAGWLRTLKGTSATTKPA